jgi:hypothetical protein
MWSRLAGAFNPVRKVETRFLPIQIHDEPLTQGLDDKPGMQKVSTEQMIDSGRGIFFESKARGGSESGKRIAPPRTYLQSG